MNTKELIASAYSTEQNCIEYWQGDMFCVKMSPCWISGELARRLEVAMEGLELISETTGEIPNAVNTNGCYTCAMMAVKTLDEVDEVGVKKEST